MGGGLLPVAVHKGCVYFLLGKEGKYEDSAPGYSDFGGGTDRSESYLATAVREAAEELTGFLGTAAWLRKQMQSLPVYPLMHYDDTHTFPPYRTHVVPLLPYDPQLPLYFNRNRSFLLPRLSASFLRTSKLFEKSHIAWVPYDALLQWKPKCRVFFRDIVQQLLDQRPAIEAFARRHSHAAAKATTTACHKRHRSLSSSFSSLSSSAAAAAARTRSKRIHTHTRQKTRRRNPTTKQTR